MLQNKQKNKFARLCSGLRILVNRHLIILKSLPFPPSRKSGSIDQFYKQFTCRINIVNKESIWIGLQCSDLTKILVFKYSTDIQPAWKCRTCQAMISKIDGLEKLIISGHDCCQRQFMIVVNAGSWLLMTPGYDCCRHRVIMIGDAGSI